MSATDGSQTDAGVERVTFGESTRIVAVDNRVNFTIRVRAAQHPDQVLTVSPKCLARCDLPLGRCDPPDTCPSHQLEVQIGRRGRTAARFWIWPDDGLVRCSSERAADPGRLAIQGDASVGGERTLTVRYAPRPAGGLLDRLRSHLPPLSPLNPARRAQARS